MRLHTKIQGHGPPVILLHGLFGSAENLGVIARALGDRFTVYALDLRNHGRSPHAKTMDYSHMATDVAETMDAHGVGTATLIGHSMGGKTAMELALAQPDRIDQLVVVDIAPIAYGHRHDRELNAMRGLDPSALRSRGEADRTLAGSVAEPRVRQFLLKNLVRASGGGFAWRIPLETIAEQYPALAAAPSATGPYDGPALFVRGGASGYVPHEAESTIRERFTNARIETIRDAAHWLHVETPEAFLDLVGPFLADGDE